MLTEIDYDIDMRLIQSESREMKGYEPFVDPKTGMVIHEWLIKKDVPGYGKRVSEEFEKILGTPVKPRFYIQEKGFTLPFHQDRGTQCCVNFVLSTSSDPTQGWAAAGRTCRSRPPASGRRPGQRRARRRAATSWSRSPRSSSSSSTASMPPSR